LVFLGGHIVRTDKEMVAKCAEVLGETEEAVIARSVIGMGFKNEAEIIEQNVKRYRLHQTIPDYTRRYCDGTVSVRTRDDTLYSKTEPTLWSLAQAEAVAGGNP